MNKILMLMALYLASDARQLVAASCVELENICSSDSFEYNGVLVNAFYRVQWNLTFNSLSDYLIDDTVKCDLSEFKNKTNFWKVCNLKRAYNRKFAEFYTEDLIGNKTEELEHKRLQISFNGWIPLWKMAREEARAKCVKSFAQKAQFGVEVFNYLIPFFRYNKHAISSHAETPYKPTISQLEAIERLDKLMDELRAGSDGQTFAFGPDTAIDVYLYEAVFLPKEFKFLKEGSDRVGPDTKSMLTYDLFLPFNNENHDNDGCAEVQDLPWFYKRKGTEY